MIVLWCSVSIRKLISFIENIMVSVSIIMLEFRFNLLVSWMVIISVNIIVLVLIISVVDVLSNLCILCVVFRCCRILRISYGSIRLWNSMVNLVI